MPSPFPGMNPYLETSFIWEDFHHAFLSHARDSLVPHAGPNYRIRLEQRVLLRELTANERLLGRSDVHVVPQGQPGHSESRGLAGTAATMTLPLELPGVEEIKELFLNVVDRRDQRVVTVIELLSPTNKKPGDSDAYAYWKKRLRLLRTGVQLVEIDLLRGGERPEPPMTPRSDYQMTVARQGSAAGFQIWSVGLRDPLPLLPIPRAEPDSDMILDVKAVLEKTHDLAGYALEIYQDQPVPPLLPADAAWAEELLRGVGLRPPVTA